MQPCWESFVPYVFIEWQPEAESLEMTWKHTGIKRLECECSFTSQNFYHLRKSRLGFLGMITVECNGRGHNSLFMWYSFSWLNVYWYFKRSEEKWMEAFPTLTEFFSHANKDQLESTDIARFEMSEINEDNVRPNNSFET